MFPILIQIGPFPLYTYGLFVALGIFAALYISIALARVDGIAKKQAQNYFYKLLIYFVLGGIIGARIFYVALSWDEFKHDLIAILKIHEGGLVSFGGLAGALAGFFLFHRKKKIDAYGVTPETSSGQALNKVKGLRVLDWLAPGLALGHALGRMGCFFAGCCYGLPTDKAWGILFSHPLSLAPLGIPLHPTQIYEFIFLLLLGSYLAWRFFQKRALRCDGLLFTDYLLLYLLGRFVIEFFRGDQAQIWGLSEGQVLSLLAFIGVLIFRFYLSKTELTRDEKSD